MWLLLFVVPAVLGGEVPGIETMVHPFQISHEGASLRMDHPVQPQSSNSTRLPALFKDYQFDASNFPADPDSGVGRSECMSSVPTTQVNTVCNPDQLITRANATLLNDQILAIRQKAPCQCGKQCGSNGRDGHFNIAIAIVKDLKTSYGNDHCAADKCRVFATELRAVKWFPWLQVCDDGIVIALSDGNGLTGQGRVYTSTGPKARSKISNECADKIFAEVSEFCSVGNYYKCLSEMLVYYENALTGGACGRREGGTALTAGQIVGIVFGVIFGVALIAGLVACCVGYCRGSDFVVGTCLGRLCGCFLGCWQTLINILIIRTCCRLCGVEELDCVAEGE